MDMFPGMGHVHRLLVVVAHPDDETFGCGSLLLRAADEGIMTAVCCATKGDAGEPAPGYVVPDGDLGAAREAELHAAARAMEVSRVDVLAYGDSGMGGDPGPGTLAAARAEDLLAELRRVVAGFEPDALITLDAADGHRDHVVVRDATVAVGAERGLPVLLQCLPRSLMQAWLAHMRTAHPETPYLGLEDLGTPDDRIDLVLDQQAHLPARERAIALHRSQVSPFEGLPDQLREAFLAHDHLVHAN